MVLQFSEQFESQNNECHNEEYNRNTVDAMHVFHPLSILSVGILFLDKEILTYLS